MSTHLRADLHSVPSLVMLNSKRKASCMDDEATTSPPEAADTIKDTAALRESCVRGLSKWGLKTHKSELWAIEANPSSIIAADRLSKELSSSADQHEMLEGVVNGGQKLARAAVLSGKVPKIDWYASNAFSLSQAVATSSEKSYREWCTSLVLPGRPTLEHHVSVVDEIRDLYPQCGRWADFYNDASEKLDQLTLSVEGGFRPSPQVPPSKRSTILSDVMSMALKNQTDSSRMRMKAERKMALSALSNPDSYLSRQLREVDEWLDPVMSGKVDRFSCVRASRSLLDDLGACRWKADSRPIVSRFIDAVDDDDDGELESILKLIHHVSGTSCISDPVPQSREAIVRSLRNVSSTHKLDTPEGLATLQSTYAEALPRDDQWIRYYDT